MELVSVNVSPVREVEYKGRRVRTGIYKTPVHGPVMARALGLDGDGQAEDCHGGRDMAVYAFTRENYDRWAAELGRKDLHAGKFGENLTVTGMPESEVCIGDRFRVGEAEFEVSVPRAPCSKLAMVMDDPGFPKVFLATGDVGFYLRVVREGEVRAGEAIAWVHRDPARLSIREVTLLMYFDVQDKKGAARAAGLKALSEGWRRKFEGRM